MMQDTSFAIHPGTKKQLVGENFKDIGKLLSHHIEKDVIYLKGENGAVAVMFYNENTVRIIMNPKQQPHLKSSFAVIKEQEKITYEVIDTEESLEVKSTNIVIKITKKPFRLSIFEQNGTALVTEANKGMGFNENGEVIRKWKRLTIFMVLGRKLVSLINVVKKWRCGIRMCMHHIIQKPILYINQFRFL
jgi:alpha-glucosidase